MEKQELLKEIYDLSFKNELNKIAGDKEIGQRVQGAIGLPLMVASGYMAKDILDKSKKFKELKNIRLATKYGLVPAIAALGGISLAQLLAPEKTKKYFG